jgi:NADH:ubiquinone oxidoreductase subunit 3 (subunit A)
MGNAVALDYLVLAGFVVIGAVFCVLILGVNWVLRPDKPTARKLSVYECGREPVGPPWVQLRIGYYVYALLFVVFDIETVFLYPWAVAFGAFGWYIVLEMVIFLGILVAGLIYAWREGALSWR